MSDCVFCSIVAKARPAVFLAETDRAFAFMNANPAGFGHALVIPKAHATDIWELTTEDGAAVWELTRHVADAARDALNPDGLNLFQANRRAGWQSVFHFHIHVVPRWTGDDLVPNWTEPLGDRTRIEEAADLLRPRIEP
jgi:histidine triad (HIT) family protein